MIAILVATYNGEKYISEQIESLLYQTEQEFIIYINDDCSTDQTGMILEDYARAYPGKIEISRNEVNSGSAKHNFFQMMKAHTADYVMLCDQDDVWLPNKIELTLKKMHEAENRHEKGTPILIHTDLTVVDEKLKIISQSFKEAMNSDFHKIALNNQVIQNTLTGCTSMYNSALANFIVEEPEYMVMHDWWLNLVASAFGTIEHIPQQTVLYRQHNANEIGAKDVRTLKYKMDRLLHIDDMKRAMSETYLQAENFLEIYRERLTSQQKELLEGYIEIPKLSKMQKWIRIVKLGTYKTGIARKIAQFLYI